MKLRNRKTGEIIEFDAILPVKDVSGDSVAHLEYNSLTEFNEEWEDAPEEPKDYWYINGLGNVIRAIYATDDFTRDLIAIGNYFETIEEAEKAVEKLKAWKRLKDKGFRFEGWDNTDRSTIHNFSLFVAIEDLESINKDLDLLFGGEE